MIETPQNSPPVAEGSPRPMSRQWLQWIQLTLLRAVQMRCTPTSVKTAAYTAKPWDRVVCDPTAGGFTVTLPTRCENDTLVEVKNRSASVNAITIAAGTGDTVEGGASTSIAAAFESVRLAYSVAARTWDAV